MFSECRPFLSIPPNIAKMASAAGHRNPKCHVLNFFYDDHNGCALTILVNEVRFHIIADANRLQPDSKSGSKLFNEFKDLLRAVKHQDQDFTRPSSHENLRSSPVDPGSQDSGHGASENGDEGDSDHDSAIDTADQKSKSKEPWYLDNSHDDPQQNLNNWMLQPFGPIFDDKAPHTSSAENQSVADWYERPTFFYNLEQDHGKLKASEEDSTEDLQRRMQGIVPKLPMPKYIRSLDIPWYPSKDVVVLNASDDPVPYHPSRVKVGDETYFLKVVDSTQPQPTKREIDIMKRIEAKGLHEQIRVPLVKGLVGYEDSHIEIIGFLQTEIEDPTPLTNMLDDDVPQAKRDEWAKESGRIKDLLHEHNIVWGDAKADNFMVDKHDNLWIIDFGGSYTDGWIDPELMESREGDDMGVDKIIDALHDPVANTLDPAQDEGTRYQEQPVSPSSLKRKADDYEDGPEEDEDQGSDKENQKSRSRKRAKAEASPEPAADEQDEGDFSKEGSVDEDVEDQEIEKEQFCICNKPSSGDMIGCDNDDCAHQWFHFECVGLDKAPRTEQWYCEDCRS